MTGSLERAMGETNRRRELQIAYNSKHGITPTTIKKEIRDIAESMRSEHQKTVSEMLSIDQSLFKRNPKAFIKEKRAQMEQAVAELDFETAALLRDEIYALEGKATAPQPARRKRR